jgi:hypothetical protein
LRFLPGSTVMRAGVRNSSILAPVTVVDSG